MRNSTCQKQKYLRIAAFSATIFAVIGMVRCESASAARLLQVHVERDGQLVLHTYYDDGGKADAATVWRYLGRQPIMLEEETMSVEPDTQNPLRATVDGDILIRFSHVDRVLAQTKLTRLNLIRSDAQSSMWFLSEQEVERTATIAGLGPPSAVPEVDFFAVSVLVGFALLVVVFLVFVVVVASLVRRARTPRET
ncbi:MAG: hypothetical protein H8E44_42505 [Planctomycetes bacterium]|nr:hypothetical protein [Planctomycetota bacterium]MBL7044432.1 hypothetical protein [Pirellulaceae bacterium]